MIKAFSKQVYEFTGSNGEKVYTKYNAIAELPDWVAQTPTFKLAEKADMIMVYESKEDEKKIDVVANSKGNSKIEEDIKDKKSPANSKK